MADSVFGIRNKKVNMMRLLRENGNVDEADILALEDRVGRKLPIQYRGWLSKTGGGELIDSAIRSGVDDEPVADIPELFSIDKILNELDLIGEKLPADWLPIGTSYGGDVAIIDTVSGEILYLFTSHFYDKEVITRDCSIKIAEDFEQLGNNLRPFDDVMKEIRN